MGDVGNWVLTGVKVAGGLTTASVTGAVGGGVTEAATASPARVGVAGGGGVAVVQAPSASIIKAQRPRCQRWPAMRLVRERARLFRQKPLVSSTPGGRRPNISLNSYVIEMGKNTDDDLRYQIPGIVPHNILKI